MTRTSLLLIALLSSCGKDDGAAKQGATPTAVSEPLPANYSEVPQHAGLIIEVPPGAKPMAGNPGFKTDDMSFAMVIAKVGAGDSQDIAALKTVIGERVKTWLREETTADGWIATFTLPKMESSTDANGERTSKEVGLEYGLQMHRTIDGVKYKCAAGTLPTPEGLDAVIKACNTLRRRG